MLQKIEILGVKIPMYSLMIVVGVIAYLLWLYLGVIRKERLDRKNGVSLLVTSVFGLAVLYACSLVIDSIFMSIQKGRFSFGSITWLGGFIGALPVTIFLIHMLVPCDKGRALNRFSTLMPGFILAHAFGRVGCFFAGCCHGAPTDSFLGVVFPGHTPAGNLYPDYNSNDYLISSSNKIFFPSVPVLPTQLIEACFELLLVIIMIALYKRLKNYNIELYCIAYGIFRFTLEFFRGDTRGETGFFLTPSQLMSIIIWAYAVIIILYRKGILFKRVRSKCRVWAENADRQVLESKEARRLEVIRVLDGLKRDGLITEGEFEAKKAQILNIKAPDFEDEGTTE